MENKDFNEFEKYVKEFYIQLKMTNKSKNTINSYKNTLNAFLSYIKE